MRLRRYQTDTTHKVTRVVAGLRGRVAVGRHDVTGVETDRKRGGGAARFNVEKAPTTKFNVGLRPISNCRRRIHVTTRWSFPESLFFPLSCSGRQASFVDSPDPRCDVTSRPIEPTSLPPPRQSVGRAAAGRRARTIVWRARQTGWWMVGVVAFVVGYVLLLCLGRGSHGQSSRLSWSGEWKRSRRI